MSDVIERANALVEAIRQAGNDNLTEKDKAAIARVLSATVAAGCQKVGRYPISASS